MNLKQFAQSYKELENKSYKIMEIYGVSDHSLDGIDIEEFEGKTLFHIKTSIYYSGCGEESEWLSFELDEMDNDLEYFRDKRKELLEQEALQKKLNEEKEILRKEEEKEKKTT